MIFNTGPKVVPSILWSTGQTSETITPDSTDTYYVTVTGESGCTATADYWINVTQETPTIAAIPIYGMGDLIHILRGPISPLCTSTAYALSCVNQLNNQYSYYQWSNGSYDWWISVYNSGTYYVTITDNNGCTGVDSIAVTVIPTITATGDPICNSEPMILDAGPNDASYLWSTGQTSETITPDSTDTYYVTVTVKVAVQQLQIIGLMLPRKPLPLLIFQLYGMGI